MSEYGKNSYLNANATTEIDDLDNLIVPGLYVEEPNSPVYFNKRFCYKYVNNPMY